MFSDIALMMGQTTAMVYCDTDEPDKMPPAPVGKSKKVEDIWAKLLRCDLRFVILRLSNEGICKDFIEADEMVTEYMKYLALTIAYPYTKLPMSAQVDEAWHQHILHTRSYAAFCEEVAGRFIHHLPAMDESARVRMVKDYADNTLALYEKHFGEPPARWWGAKQAVCFDPACD